MNQTLSQAVRRTPAELAPALVGEVAGLVSPPDVCARVFELIQSPDATINQIGEVIARDPNLTARLLRLVNSSFYNFTRKIDTVSRAVTIIGVRDLYNIVIAVSAVNSFNRLPNNIVNMDTFWRHSLYCGLIARSLAKHRHVLHPERLFVAGLLHDIGSLVLYNKMPDVMRDLLLIADGDEEVLHTAETEEFGFSHADLGGLLLRSWQLPEILQEAVSHHHTPAMAGNAAMESAIVHVASVLANRSEIGAYCEGQVRAETIDTAAWRILGLGEAGLPDEDLNVFIGEAGLQFGDTAMLISNGRG